MLPEIYIRNTKRKKKVNGRIVKNILTCKMLVPFLKFANEQTISLFTASMDFFQLAQKLRTIFVTLSEFHVLYYYK